MSTALLASPSTFRTSARRPMAVVSLLVLLAGGLCVAFPGHALDLVAFTGITGPMTSALTHPSSTACAGEAAVSLAKTSACT